jgi:hypothetical protein
LLGLVFIIVSVIEIGVIVAFGFGKVFVFVIEFIRIKKNRLVKAEILLSIRRLSILLLIGISTAKYIYLFLIFTF